MKFFFFVFLIFSQIKLFSQTFSYFTNEKSTSSISLGGNLLTKIDDIILSSRVPSLIGEISKSSLSFNYINYSSEINSISFAYANEIKSFGVYSLGINKLDYGDFDSYDSFGNSMGQFDASDLNIFFALQKKLSINLSMGICVELINSVYENYNSTVISSNTSLTYTSENKDFVSSLALNNVARTVDNFSNHKQKLPMSINFGVSKTVKYLPFTYYLNFHNLQKFDISGPVQSNQSYREDETIAKKLLYHLNIGGELNPMRKNLYIRLGFNFQRRFQMTLDNYPSVVGFSTGIGFKFSRYSIDYAIASTHLSNVINSFNLKMNLSNFTNDEKKY